MDLIRIVNQLKPEQIRYAKAILELRDLPGSCLEDPESISKDSVKMECADAILDACSISNKKRDLKVSALLKLSQLYVLFWQGLYKEASELLIQLKEEFESKEDYALMQLIHQLEIYLCSVDWEKDSFENRLDQHLKDYVITTHKSIDLLSRWSLDTKLNRLLIKRGPSKNIMDTYEYDHLKEDVFVQKNKNPLSVYSRYYQLRCEKHLYELDGNAKQLYSTNKQIVSLMENNPLQFAGSSSNLIYAYYDCGKTALMLDMIPQTQDAISKIRALEVKSEIGCYDRMNFSLSLEIESLLHQKKFDTVVSMEPQINELFEETAYSNMHVKGEHRKFYDYHLGVACLWRRNNAKSLLHIQNITGSGDGSNMFKDLYSAALKVELFNLLMQGNWAVLEERIKFSTDFWQASQQFNQLEASMTQMLRRICKTQGNSIELDLKKWLGEISPILQDPLEKNSLQNFDLEQWLKSILNDMQGWEKSNSSSRSA